MGRSRCCQIGLLMLMNWFQFISSVDVSFKGHRLLRVIPENDRQVDVLQKLHYHPPDDLQGLDFWNEPSEPNERVYILVTPLQEKSLDQYLRKWRLQFEIVTDNLQSLLDEHALRNLETRIDNEVSIYDTYLTFDEAMVWLEKTAELCGLRCSLLNIGRSYEGRHLTLIKITSDKPSAVEDPREKPAVWIDSGIHAREWISPATALYFIDRLVTDYDLDAETRFMVDRFDWYILPFVNPDGYHYSHGKNRLWRKTRSKIPDSSCIGVDANRNFPFHWRSVGFTDDPCTDMFPGRKPFSEPETKALADFILSRNGTWNVFLTLHSYGQLWMAPYGYTNKKPDNYEAMMAASAAAKSAIEDVYRTEYTIGSASDILYRSSGTSRDWAAGVPRIPFVYTIELRDKGPFGFLLPPEQILPTGIETWQGVKALIRQVKLHHHDHHQQQQQQTD